MSAASATLSPVESSVDTELPVVEFPAGLPGFPGLHGFVLVPLDERATVHELTSVDQPDVSFVVVPSVAYFPDYAPEVDDLTVELLHIESVEDVVVLLIVTVGESMATTTANLMAPVVINTKARRGAQVVLDATHPLRAPLVSRG